MWLRICAAFANLAANVPANVGGARSCEFGCEFDQLCKFGCECRRGDKPLRMSANARCFAKWAANAGERCQPYECRKFANICDKKRSRVFAKSGGGSVWRRAPGHEKGGKISRLLIGFYSGLCFRIVVAHRYYMHFDALPRLFDILYGVLH